MELAALYFVASIPGATWKHPGVPASGCGVYVCVHAGVGRSVVVEDHKEASGTRFSLLWEYDSAYLEKGAPAPQESLTVHYENVDDVNSAGDAFLARDGEDEGRRDEPGHSLSTTSLFLQADNKKVAAGVLPQHTFRHDYVIYDASQVRCEETTFPDLLDQRERSETANTGPQWINEDLRRTKLLIVRL